MRHFRLFFASCFVFTSLAHASPVDPAVERIMRDHLGNCPPTLSMELEPVTQKLPRETSAIRVNVKSESGVCSGSYMLLRSRDHVFVGNPWPLGDYKGTAEERIRTFGWERMGQSFQAKVDRTRPIAGFFPVELTNTTDQGRVLMPGMVDPDSNFFFLGRFRAANRPAAADRIDKLGSVVKRSPSLGPADSAVHLIEFSDFQCPSCRYASTFLKPLLEKYGDRIRYTRVDFPIISAHPWAFGAAVMGRAIHRQDPALFWKYKEAVYGSQDRLNLFTLEDFSRQFVEDHGLDLARYDADVQSEALRLEILEGVGAAYSLPVLSTPTFLVNGEVVNTGRDGRTLDSYIASLLNP